MKNTIFCGVLLFLVGCVEKSNFSCPAVKSGKKCLTITESDNLANHQVKNELIDTKTKGKVIIEEPIETFTTTRIVPKRTEEKIGKIWIAPHYDEEGNFYDENYIYVILKPAIWNFKSNDL
jgi:hypothetical protein